MLYANDGIYTVGLTGMSGAGKTTACRIFAGSGFTVIDCDITARNVVTAGRPALEMIAHRFSRDILKADGTLDRRKLGGIIFSDSTARDALNGIIYPYITFEIIRDISDFRADGSRLFLLDAPTLFESGADMLCDSVVCVTSDLDACAERIMKRDGLTRLQAKERLSSQHDAAFYTERSDYSAVNSGSIEEFEQSLRRIAGKLHEDAEKAIREVRI